MKEIKFYSIGRGSLNLNGKFYYGLDYAITDFMNSLEQENKKYKDVIDKAINCLTRFPDRWTSDEKKEVLQILKEVSK